MADEAQLLALLRDNPKDVAARLVYADWLEERGHAPRAEILRAVHALSQLTLDSDAVVERGRALLSACAHEEPSWLAAIDHRLLLGTTWATSSNSGEAGLLGFQPGGILVFRRASGKWPGTWSALGNAVTFTINKYSPHEGVFFGERMDGAAWNTGDQHWTWGAVRLPDRSVIEATPFPEIPADTPKDSAYTRGKKPRRARRQSAGE